MVALAQARRSRLKQLRLIVVLTLTSVGPLMFRNATQADALRRVISEPTFLANILATYVASRTWPDARCSPDRGAPTAGSPPPAAQSDTSCSAAGSSEPLSCQTSHARNTAALARFRPWVLLYPESSDARELAARLISKKTYSVAKVSSMARPDANQLFEFAQIAHAAQREGSASELKTALKLDRQATLVRAPDGLWGRKVCLHSLDKAHYVLFACTSTYLQTKALAMRTSGRRGRRSEVARPSCAASSPMHSWGSH